MAYVKGIAATTNLTVLVTHPLKVLIMDASILMGTPVIIAFFRAQIVQLVRRAQVAQVAVDAQPARLANTKQVLLKQTVSAVILVRIRFRLDVAGLQRDIVLRVRMGNMYTVLGPDHAKIAVRAPRVSLHLDVTVMAQVRERARIVQVVPQASTEVDVAVEMQEVAQAAQVATREPTELDVVVQVRERAQAAQVATREPTEVDVVVQVQGRANLANRVPTSRLLARNHAQVTPTTLVLQGNI